MTVTERREPQKEILNMPACIMSCTIKPNKTKIKKLVGNLLLAAESKQDTGQ